MGMAEPVVGVQWNALPFNTTPSYPLFLGNSLPMMVPRGSPSGSIFHKGLGVLRPSHKHKALTLFGNASSVPSDPPSSPLPCMVQAQSMCRPSSQDQRCWHEVLSAGSLQRDEAAGKSPGVNSRRCKFSTCARWGGLTPSAPRPASQVCQLSKSLRVGRPNTVHHHALKTVTASATMTCRLGGSPVRQAGDVAPICLIPRHG